MYFNIKRIQKEQFGEFVLNNLKDGQTVEFALDVNPHYDEDCTNWWVAFWIVRPEYSIRSLYIDYAGGGYPAVFEYEGDDDDFQYKLTHFFRYLDGYTDEEGINIDLNSLKEEE